MTIFRIHPQAPFNFAELVVDNFAGGGGASTGIEQATGRPVDIAINHNPIALAMHETNHPHTRHYCESVWDVDPRQVTAGRPVGLAWFSPDCRHFSKAKGGAPVSPQVRGLAWVVLRWAGTVKPRIIMLENVEEFTTWGPLIRQPDGSMLPDPKRKGQTFRAFVRALERHGYRVEKRELRACDYGAPTIRKRLFLIARCDGQPIVWPEPTHGPGLTPYRTAADIIDWSQPCPSIFERKRPLADATCRRIAEGIKRFVIEAQQPFLLTLTHGGRLEPLTQPMRTITAAHRGEKALVCPTLMVNTSGHPGGRADKPLHTITTGGHHALVAAFLAKHYTGVTGTHLGKPLGTVTTVDHHSLVTSHLMKLRGTNVGSAVTDPLHTISAGGTHHAEVRSFLIKYYGSGDNVLNLREPLHTIPTRDRFGLVTIHGQPYQIVDIGMRMLQPHELIAAQGFPPDYIHDRTWNGDSINKTDQVKMIGNSVCPPVVRALVAANFESVKTGERHESRIRQLNSRASQASGQTQRDYALLPA